MAAGDFTLSIPGVPSLVLRPNNTSVRSEINRIALDTDTGQGIATATGITARGPRYSWRLDARIAAWELARLKRIIERQQQRMGAGTANGVVTATDECFRVDAIAAARDGRSIASSVVVEGETLAYCAFNVRLELGEGAAKLLRFTGDGYDPYKIALVVVEL